MVFSVRLSLYHLGWKVKAYAYFNFFTIHLRIESYL